MSGRLKVAAAVAAVVVLSLIGVVSLHFWNKLNEPAVTVTWSVDYSGEMAHTAKLPPKTSQGVTAKLEEVLESDKGWKRHNLIGFRHIDDPKAAEIIFRPTQLHETRLACDNVVGAMGCSGGSLPFNRPDSCRVFFSQELLKPAEANVRVAVVNHELGHCFLGGAHTESGLMTANLSETTAETMYPSTEEILRGVRNIRPMP